MRKAPYWVGAAGAEWSASGRVWSVGRAGPELRKPAGAVEAFKGVCRKGHREEFKGPAQAGGGGAVAVVVAIVTWWGGGRGWRAWYTRVASFPAFCRNVHLFTLQVRSNDALCQMSRRGCGALHVEWVMHGACCQCLLGACQSGCSKASPVERPLTTCSPVRSGLGTCASDFGQSSRLVPYSGGAF